MKGVTMGAGTPVTLAVIFYLATVLEATYLERPLWVADKGRQQSVAHANEDSHLGQLQAANEQTWMQPEQYYPQRNGPAVGENQPRPQESSNAAQLVREERPPLDSFLPNQGYDGRNQPDASHEYQTNYQPQSMNNGQQSQSSWLNQQQQQQGEYQKPYLSLEPSKLQAQPEPEYYEAYGQQGWNQESKPEISKPNNYQPQLQPQESYNPYRPDTYQPKPDAELASNQPKPGSFRPNQPNGESFQSKPEDMQQNNAQKRPQEVQQSNKPYPARPELYQPSSQEIQQNNNPYPARPELYQPSSQEIQQSNKPYPARPELYQPSSQEVQQNNNPYPARPELYQPSSQEIQQNNKPYPARPELYPSSPQEIQQSNNPYPARPELYQPSPQELQQGNKPYPARPELYQLSPSFVEPEYQVPYYGQQSKPSYTGPEYQMQMPTNKQPLRETSKPAEQPNKVRKPQPQENQAGLAPLANSGYYPYQSQETWNSYQQNPSEGLQASVQTGPDNRVGNSMSIYQLPSMQGSYDREPIVEKFKPTDRVVQQQENRKPPQPFKTEQRPNRPVDRLPEEPSYQPNRVPSATWDTQYKPQPAPVMPKPQPAPVMPKPQPVPVMPKPQPAPVMPKPQPQQRPPVVEPTYNRRPEPYYGNNDNDDDEVVVKYERPITRYDNRCPRDDDPAKPVHFPSTTSCIKFQKCFNGIAYEMSCPLGLEFDSQSNRCDYPARARCSV